MRKGSYQNLEFLFPKKMKNPTYRVSGKALHAVGVGGEDYCEHTGNRIEVGPCRALTVVGSSAPCSHLLTPPQQDGGGNQKSKSEKTRGLR